MTSFSFVADEKHAACTHAPACSRTRFVNAAMKKKPAAVSPGFVRSSGE
jgi:hypothetical protein